MLRMLYDPHTHTNYSHGVNTIAQMCEAAHKAGMRELHITEHGNMHYYARKLTLADYLEMKEQIIEQRALYPEMKIVFGIEANIVSMEGELDFTPKEMECFDEINMGFHMLCKMKRLSGYLRIHLPAILYTKLKLKAFYALASRNCTLAALAALERYKINMITHPGSNYPFDIEKIAQKCEKTDTLLEINNSRARLSVEDARIAAKYGVRFALGSDAHRAEDIGKCSVGIQIIAESGLESARVVNMTEEQKS